MKRYNSILYKNYPHVGCMGVDLDGTYSIIKYSVPQQSADVEMSDTMLKLCCGIIGKANPRKEYKL